MFEEVVKERAADSVVGGRQEGFVKMFDSILLALSLAVTGEANAGSRQASDSAEVPADVTTQIVAEVFEPGVPKDNGIGQRYSLSEITSPEQDFPSEFESWSSSARERETRTIDIREQDMFGASDLPGSHLAAPQLQEGWDYNNVNPFLHDGQPQSAEGASSTGIHQDGSPILTFWQESSKASEAQFKDIRVEFAAANAMPSNVLIPLPPAVWSALSLMGGAALIRGVRRLRRQLR